MSGASQLSMGPKAGVSAIGFPRPRILILDDLFGRDVPGGRNLDRENICAHFLWRDASNDRAAAASLQEVLEPVAEAVFCRAQVPALTNVGSVVENDLNSALTKVREGWYDAISPGENPWALVLLDLCFYTGPVTHASHMRTAGMPEGRSGDDDPGGYFGLTLLDAIHRHFPDLPIVILSSKPRDEVSLEFTKRGAQGFIARDDLHGPDLFEDALWQHGLLPDPAGQVIGHSLPVLLALREARRAARHRQNLFIRGERGTGKELLAGYAHRVSEHWGSPESRPFVAVNSAVLRTDLFSSELFGIESETASGVSGKIGLIEVADGGDFFLDEIADTPSEAQAALLRVLQDRQITRVGGRRPKAVDVRFLSATNADLENDSRDFRSDLLDRLRMGGTLWLPPLRDRRIDIPLLSETFVRQAEMERHGTFQRTIAPEAMEMLMNHSWGGNIRELRACLFDAVNRNPDVEHLVPNHLRAALGKSISLAKPSQPQPEVLLSSRPSGLSALLAMQSQTRFEPAEIAQWSGRLIELQLGQARFVARYLKAALDATRRRTAEHPEGLIQIHPAVKLITGDPALTASKAADVIKRLLTTLEAELEGDLREALAIAVRLRPRSLKGNSLS